ncbi:zona pellucida-binding protein 2 [Cyanocitta cristata]
MAGGGGRPRCPPSALLGVAAVVVAAGWGDILQFCIAVNVYVKVFTNSPFLVCMDLALSQERIIDPNYLWIGPDGRDLEGQSYVNLTETGKLMVMGFRESMSGAYTCTLSHKIIEAMTQEETEMVEAYKFMVYAYREADHAYQVSVRFSTTRCKLKTNGLFVEKLNKILNSTISYLTCHISQSSYKCHSIRTPKNGLQYELFVNFLVQYVDNSFSMTPIDSCRPGFGKNHHTHQNCASCCVVCGPGTYSPNSEVTCRTCARPQARMYGAKSCF